MAARAAVRKFMTGTVPLTQGLKDPTILAENYPKIGPSSDDGHQELNVVQFRNYSTKIFSCRIREISTKIMEPTPSTIRGIYPQKSACAWFAVNFQLWFAVNFQSNLTNSSTGRQLYKHDSTKDSVS